MFHVEDVEQHGPRYAIEAFTQVAAGYLPLKLHTVGQSDESIIQETPGGDGIFLRVEPAQGMARLHVKYEYSLHRSHTIPSGTVNMELRFRQFVYEPVRQTLTFVNNEGHVVSYVDFMIDRNRHSGRIDMGIAFNRSTVESTTAYLILMKKGKFEGKLKTWSNFPKKNYNIELPGHPSATEEGGELYIPDTVPQIRRYQMATDWPLITAAFNTQIGNSGEPINPLVCFPQAYAKIERYTMNFLRAD